MAPSVPAKDCAAMELSGRTYSSILLLSSRAVNAMRVRSGERTGGPALPPCSTNAVPGGGRMDDRTTATGRPHHRNRTPGKPEVGYTRHHRDEQQEASHDPGGS